MKKCHLICNLESGKGIKKKDIDKHKKQLKTQNKTKKENIIKTSPKSQKNKSTRPKTKNKTKNFFYHIYLLVQQTI